jgi:endoglucanase
MEAGQITRNGRTHSMRSCREYFFYWSKVMNSRIGSNTVALISAWILFIATTLWSAPPELKVNGTKFVTVNGGCEVRLVGVNTCGCEWSANGYGPPSGSGGNIVKSVEAAITTWKANCLRIPLNQDFWFGYSDGISKSSATQSTANQTKYQTIIDSAIAAASRKNAYAELDLHWSGNGSWGSSVTAKQQNMPDDHSTDFWLDIAKRYKNNPDVLFNLYNEPKNDTWDIWKNGGQSKSGFHTPGFQSLVGSIRSTGAKNIIIVGGLAWAYDMTGIKANALTDSGSGNGIAYEAHIYDNKGAGEPGIWNTNVTVAVTAGYCVVIGEFGPKTDGSQDKSNCTPYETDLLQWIDGGNTANYAYSAMGWSFNTDAPPKLIANWNFDATSCHGDQVKAWLASVKQSSCAAKSTFQSATARTAQRTAPIRGTQLFDLSGRAVTIVGMDDLTQRRCGVLVYRATKGIRKLIAAE